MKQRNKLVLKPDGLRRRNKTGFGDRLGGVGSEKARGVLAWGLVNTRRNSGIFLVEITQVVGSHRQY